MTGVLKQKLLLSLAIAAAVVLAGVLAVAQFGSSARAQAASPPQPAQQARCSLATLNGTHVVDVKGVQVTGSSPGPLAVVGVIVFDGRGHAQGFVSRSLNGNISRHGRFTSAYTLNSDCTGTYTVTEATGAVRHYDLYSLPSGNRVTLLRTDPGIVASGDAEAR